MAQCAEAYVAAGQTKREVIFERRVVSGMWCPVSTDPEAWTDVQLSKLRPLAVGALGLPTTGDHRDANYRTLMYISVTRTTRKVRSKWGDRWLGELDAIKLANDEERSALDFARVLRRAN